MSRVNKVYEIERKKKEKNISNGKSDLSELSLGHAVSVEDEACGLVARGFVELDEELSDHGGQVLDDLLPGPLHTHRGTVTTRVSVHAAHHLHINTHIKHLNSVLGTLCVEIFYLPCVFSSLKMSM